MVPNDDRPPGRPEHFSVSQMNMYIRCPQQYDFRYEQGLRRPPGAAQTRGSGLHHGAETWYTEKLVTGKNPKPDVAREAAAAYIEDNADETDWGDEKPAAIKDRVVILAGVFAKDIGKKVEPAVVEERMEFDLPGVSHPMVAYPDLFTAHAVRDLKTTTRKPGGDAVEQSVQLGGYAWAYFARYDRWPNALWLDFVVDKREPEAVMLVEGFEQPRAASFLRTAQGVDKSIEDQNYYPKTDGWHCSEKWCGYWDMCKGGRLL